jgi:DNA-binding response OmpR family regulator
MNSTSLAGRLILICEDESLIALDIARCFEESGARTVMARSLQAALVAVEDASLSAVVLDHALGRR